MNSETQKLLDAKERALIEARDKALTPEARKTVETAAKLAQAHREAETKANTAATEYRKFTDTVEYQMARTAAEAEEKSLALFRTSRKYIGLAEALQPFPWPMTHIQLGTLARAYPAISSALLTVHPSDKDAGKVGKVTESWWNGDGKNLGAVQHVEVARETLKAITAK